MLGAVYAARRRGKTKAVAVTLAVFLSFWTWLYTYKRDRPKFWVGFALGPGVALFVSFVVGTYLLASRWLMTRGPSIFPLYMGATMVTGLVVLFFLASFVASLIVWVFAIVDTARKKQEWYELY